MAEPFRAESAESCVAQRDGPVLRVTGDIDQGNWIDLADRVAAEVRTGLVHLDLTQVSFFGAAGIRALMYARDDLPPGRTLHVSCAPMVLHAMRICGLLTLTGLVVTPGADGQQWPAAWA
ncbi:hypothetical protein KRM28CT15_22830 [Krasilnikovia sp. M28-CT-15]